jgi:NADP-dependent 3-hydroxy acid dehydrogenase YdfG
MNTTVLISGASKGIGRAIAMDLATLGCHVILVARDGFALKALSEEIQDLNGKASFVTADLRDTHSLENQLSDFLEQSPPVDVLINNAGIGYFKPIEEYSTEEFDGIFEVNVRGAFVLSKMVIPSMKHQRAGLIINIASDVSKRTIPNGSLYTASKYAMHALSESMRKELQPYNIRVTGIYPGLVDSSFAGSVQGAPDKMKWIKTSEIASVVRYVIQSPNHLIFDDITVHPISQEY